MSDFRELQRGYDNRVPPDYWIADYWGEDEEEVNTHRLEEEEEDAADNHESH